MVYIYQMTIMVFGRTIRLFFGRSIDLMPRRFRKQGRRYRKKSVPKRVRRNLRTARILDVKRLIAKGRENKMVSRLVENQVGHNSTITNADYYPLMPSITVGAGDNQRIGDKINVKGFYFHAQISLYSQFANSMNMPIRVRLFVLSHRSVKQSAQLATALPPFNVMLRSNDDGTAGSSLQPYDGTVNNHILPVNKDIYVVHKDISFQFAQDNITSGVDGSPMYQANKTLKFKIKCPKYLTYDQASTGVNTPVNFAPFCAVGYCFPDVSQSPDTGASTKITVTSRSFLYYEDA